MIVSDGELKNIKTGSSFVFEVVPNDRSFNQRHYEALGEIITEHVFQLMETECKLQKAYVPVSIRPCSHYEKSLVSN